MSTRDDRELGAPLDAHQFDEAALTAYLLEHVPGFGGDCAIQQFLGGQSNPTFLIEDSSGSYVLRKKPPGQLLPSAHAVDREYRVISALAHTRVPVPTTRVLCDDDSVIGQMFYVMDYVPGRVVTDREMPGYTPAERTSMFHSLVAVLGRLHSVDYQSVGLEDFGKPLAYVARQIARWSKQYEASRVEDFAPMDNVIAWLSENNPDDEQASIVHGDYRPGNVIFHNAEPTVAAVLDWELSTIGHPFADLGYFLAPYRMDASISSFGIKGLELDRLGIPPEAELLETYAEATGRDSVPNIDFYIVFSMFRLAAILAGVMRRGLDGNAADPRAVERGRTYKYIAESAWAIAQGLADLQPDR
jgi:aminoglycoside phosphotransferase (APT) family kinase protein